MLAVKNELLRGLTDAQAEAVTALASPVTLSPGEVLFRLGDQADWLYGLERGRIVLTMPMQIRGRDQDVLVEERSAGQALGWSGLIPPHRMTLTATAETDSVLFAVPRADLLRLCDARPDLGYALTQSIATVVGHRLQVVQTMWLREMQRVVGLRHG